jgi:polysaccharide pyruvyl transferase WcaK-like protein
VRERISYDYLKSLGIKAPCYLTADPAFHLDPSSETRLNEIMELEGIRYNSRLKIGISVSETLTKWSDADHGDFLKSMAMVCDSVIQKYKAQIIFIPHVTS